MFFLQVFVTARASIPDVYISPDLPPQQQLLLFDSLASLPTQLPPHMTQQHCSTTSIQECAKSSAQQAAGPHAQQQQQQPDMQAIEAIAAFLRSRLGLTLFGFDVVLASSTATCSSGATISCSSSAQQAAEAQQQQPMPQQQQQQELVVIDINYFPNYRGGSNTPALFREALLQRWQQHTAALASN
jgi:hypothetical protein